MHSSGPSPSVSVPTPVRTMVARRRILQRPDVVAARVVAVAAPGGYGKSTLLAQWTAPVEHALMRLSVRAAASDAYGLAQDIVEAFVDHGLIDAPILLPDHRDHQAWGRGLGALADMVSSPPRPHTLVIDELGRAEGPELDLLLQVLVEEIPEGSRLVLATRGETPEPVRRLRGSGTLAEVGDLDLAMDREEVAEFLTLVGSPAGSQEVERLLVGSEGWPVAVALLSGAWSHAAVSPMASVAAVNDFIDVQILGPLDPSTAEWLLMCSVLSRLTADGCEAVTGHAGAASRLELLERSHHLVHQVAPDSWQLHQLLSDRLRQRLVSEHPERALVAHARASHHLLALGDVDGAILHARQADDDRLLGRLIWSRAWPELGHGRSLVVSRWLEGIPDDRLERCPALALSAGFVASHQGDIAKTQRLSMILDAVDWGEDADLRPYHRVLQGVLGLVTLEDLVRHMSAESETLTDSDPWSTVVHYLHGSALSLVGRFDEARDALLTSLRLSRAYGIPVMQGHAASGLVLMALGGAHEPRFDECVAEIDEVMDAVGMTDIATACPVVAAWSAVRLRQGRADEAEWGAHAAWRAARAMAPAAPWAGMQVRLIVASILSELGDRSGAREALAEAMAGRGAETESPVLDALLQQTVAQCGLALGTVPLTAAELRVLRLLPTHLSFPQIGEELFLSRNTVKSQALSAYRKLGARSRAEAVAEARRLGLLGDFIPSG